ncbi:porphobilinogen deaminase [Lecanora helva]
MATPHLNPPPPPHRTLRIGTRSSALALAQVTLFTTLLSQKIPAPHLPPTTTYPIHTSLGDTNKTTDLHTLASGGKSLWTEDLETELREGRVDVIVHSMKDVPTLLPRGCVCASVGAREEARDAVVLGPRWCQGGEMGGMGVQGLGDLPQGSVVGTSSVRRAAMVRRVFPGLVIKDVRGNVGTRLRKLDDYEKEGFDALVLAGAGVQRLGLEGRISAVLGREDGVLHAVGQGALGLEWREGDEWVEGILEMVGRGKVERRVRWECVAERSLLRALEGGCSVPVGVDCVWEDGEAPEQLDERKEEITKENEGYEADDALPSSAAADQEHGGFLSLRAMVVSLDGRQCVEGCKRRYVMSDAAAEEVAWQMYKELVDKGAEEILKGIRLNREMIEGQDNA